MTTSQRPHGPLFYEGLFYGSPSAVRAEEIKDQLLALRHARASGVSRIQIGEREVRYKTDAEMAAAIAALEAELNPRRVRSVMVRPTTNKGW